MDYKSAISYVSKLRTRQPIKHFAELYRIDISGLNTNPEMIAKIKDSLKYRYENGLDLKGNLEE